MFKKTRMKYNINQSDMAKKLKVTQSMISQYESRLKKPNLYTLYNFTKAFNFKDLEDELKTEFYNIENEDEDIDKNFKHPS